MTIHIQDKRRQRKAKARGLGFERTQPLKASQSGNTHNQNTNQKQTKPQNPTTQPIPQEDVVLRKPPQLQKEKTKQGSAGCGI
jgi:hypothetical protein